MKGGGCRTQVHGGRRSDRCVRFVPRHTRGRNVTLTPPTGVFNLTEVAEQLNLAVNTWLHTNKYPVFTGSWQYYDFATDTVATKSGVANFCSLERSELQTWKDRRYADAVRLIYYTQLMNGVSVANVQSSARDLLKILGMRIDGPLPG